MCILYIACTWIDPADPGVHRSQEKYNPKKQAETGAASRDLETGPGRDERERKSMRSHLETRDEGDEPTENTGSKSPDRSKRHRSEPEESDEDKLYCSICDADVSPPLSSFLGEPFNKWFCLVLNFALSDKNSP